MDIQGLHYQNPSTWNKVIQPLQRACAQALAVVAGDCLRHCSALELKPPAREPLMVQALLHHHGGILHQTLAQLAPSQRRLSRQYVDSKRLVSVYDLAVDLAAALGKRWDKPDHPDAGPSGAVLTLARKLAKASYPERPAQLVNIAFQAFAYLRCHLDLQAMRVIHGRGESVDWLDRKLRLVDTVQNDCLRFLASWQGHPALAALVVGFELDPRATPMPLRRAIKEHSLPVAWLMRWDQHFVHIRTELARSVGAPLSPLAAAKLEAPISSKRADTIRFEKAVLADLLETLATLRGQGECNTQDVDMVAALRRVRVIPDDDALQIEAAPPADAYFDRLDLPAEESDETEAAERAAPEPDDDEDTNDHDTGVEQAHDDGADSADGDADNHASPHSLAAPEPARSRARPGTTPTVQALTERCLSGVGLTLRVGVVLQLARLLADKSLRQDCLAALQQQYLDEGVFDELDLKSKPRLSAITVQVLATRTYNASAERGVSVDEYTAARDEALAAFKACAQHCFAQAHAPAH